MSSFTFAQIRYTSALFISALFFSGCSGSGGSQSPAETEVSSTDGTSVTVDDDSVNGTTDETEDESSNGSEAGSTPAMPEPVVPDPLAENSTRVEFDITVPAYVSNALQVRLIWGDKDILARWVGDEFWSVSDDLPSNTEHLLVVTFNDGNGAITLGSFEKEFKTGTNASESYQITADQFDTNRWDTDSDGASNINELIAGTDPLVDEAVALEVRESYHHYLIPEALDVLADVSGYYESLTPKQRPYHEHTEHYQPFVLEPYTDEITSAFTIDMDESGTGSFSDTFRSWEHTNIHVENSVATRTNTENSITWTGTEYFSDSSAGLWWDIAFTTETMLIEGNAPSQNGVIDREKRGDWDGGNGTVHISYALTGEVISDSNRCKPIAGTIAIDPGVAGVNTTTITKDTDDQYWKVSVTTDGQLLDEYLMQSVGEVFYCDFGDLQ